MKIPTSAKCFRASEVKYFVVGVEIVEIEGLSSVECTAQDDFLLVVRNQLADVRDLDLFPKPKSSSWCFVMPASDNKLPCGKGEDRPNCEPLGST